MATEPQLIVALEARLDRFERQMREAGIIAEREVANIERAFKTRDFLTGIAQGIGQEIPRAIQRAIAAIPELIADLAKLGDTAKNVNISTDALQALRFAVQQGSGELKDADAAMARFAAQIGKTAEGTSFLARTLQANGIALRDTVGQFKTQEQLLQEFARLVRNAGSDAEQFRLVNEAFGRSAGPKMRDVLIEIANVGFPQFIASAKKAGAVVDQEMIEKAEKINEKWDATLLAMQNKFKTFSVLVVEGWSQMLEGATTLLSKVGKLTGATDFMRRVGEAFDAAQAEKTAEAIAKGAESLREFGREAARGRAFSALGRAPTVIPERETATRKDELERFDEQLSKHIGLLKAEAEAIGKTAGEREKARQTALVEEAAKRAGLPIEQALNAERQKEIALSAQLKEANIARAAAFNELVASSKEFGSALSEAFKGMVLEGKKLDEVLRNLANRMASRAIDKLFDLFFAAPSTGGPSAFLKLLGIGVPGRQAGGPVRAGSPFIVGEKGPELFVPNRAGIVVPNTLARRSAGGMVNVNISLAGANGDATIRQIAYDATAQGMALALRQVPRIAVDAVANQQVRFA